MYLVVGLGNIGAEYETTHHNVGFLVVEKVKQAFGLKVEKRICNALVTEGNVRGSKVMLARPTTYMNASGLAVGSLEAKFKPDTIVVVQDDIDLPIGNVRIRNTGSAGTHNGMKSVLEHIKDKNFIRVRVGIGTPIEGQDLADYVLSRIPKSSGIWQGIDTAAAAVCDLLAGNSFQEVCQKYSK